MLFYILNIGLIFVYFQKKIRISKRYSLKPIAYRTLITCTYLIFACIYYNKYSNDEVRVEYIMAHCDTTYIDRDVVYATATYYHAVEAQCDDNPYETADMSVIDTTLLNANKLRWVAVSRDLLKRNGGLFEYGDTIYVDTDNRRVRGYWIIHDTMNKRFSCAIDFLVSTNDNLGIGKETIRFYKK